ncbi:hypothetical protein AURDEDRAFT_116368 [Auricularia subglabra TFB-10046 SS5]|nr:hypothetical protein AURDEDRAFT_116368 [Auricularia subglabra TFB-10046 SS5]
MRLPWLALTVSVAVVVVAQDVDVPDDCVDVCAASQKLIDACSPVTVQCSCTEPYERGLYDCGVCVGKGNETDYALQQVQLDAFIDACASRGVNLPDLRYPGQEDNSTSASSSSTSTPTGPEDAGPTETPPNAARALGLGLAWLIAVPVALLSL